MIIVEILGRITYTTSKSDAGKNKLICTYVILSHTENTVQHLYWILN